MFEYSRFFYLVCVFVFVRKGHSYNIRRTTYVFFALVQHTCFSRTRKDEKKRKEKKNSGSFTWVSIICNLDRVKIILSFRISEIILSSISLNRSNYAVMLVSVATENTLQDSRPKWNCRLDVIHLPIVHLLHIPYPSPA